MYKIMILGAALTAAPAAAQKATTEFSTGIDYQTGKYGTGERIDILSAPATVRHRNGRVSLVATIPYHRVEGPSNAVGGGGLLGLPIIVDPTRPSTRTVREGIGDARVGAAYTIPRESLGGVALSLSGQVKIPTASRAKGLGTGEADYSVGAEVSTRIGRVVPFGAIGYTMPGDPKDYRLRNSVSARAGAVLGLSGRTEAQVSYDYARSVSALVPDEQQITTGLNSAISKRVSIGLQGSAGLSDGSPDVAAGLRIGLKL
jgi:hypothetical protein